MSGAKSEEHAKGGNHAKKHKVHHEEHEEHVNHEAWVIPYADLLTLLLAMFLALWATQKQDTAQAVALANAFRSERGVQVIQGGTGVLETSGGDNAKSVIDLGMDAARSVRAEQALKALEAQQSAQTVEDNQMDSVEKKLRQEATNLGILDKLSFKREERGLVVTIVSDQVLFQSGEAALMPYGVDLLDVLTGPIVALRKPISIEGHTDNIPVSGKFSSNWELSTARATNVLRYLVERHGFDPNLISASGYADTKPAGSNATAEGRSSNRRVAIVVLSTVSKSLPSAPPVTAKP